MAKPIQLAVLAPATQRTLKTAALAASGDRLIRTDVISLNKLSDEAIVASARSHTIITAEKNADGMPASSLWSQLNSVYVDL